MVNIKKFLTEHSDARYADFNKKFITSKYPILGVRVPTLKKFAKEIEPEFIDLEENLSYEEILLYGFSAACIKDEDEQLEYLQNILPFIDNWGSCDSIVCSLKKLTGQKSYDFFTSLLTDEREFYVRVGIVGLMANFKKSDKIDEILENFRHITAQQRYVKMALAWFYAELCAINLPLGKKTIAGLEDTFVRNQAIKKACESFRVSQPDKAEILKLKK